MVKLSFTKFERTAGLFMLAAFVGFVSFTVFVAYKQGWFESKVILKTTFKQGEGLRSGTPVQISGLRAGTVEKVFLSDENKIEVVMSVSGDFAKKIKKDSIARVIRPFIIGDKVVELTLGETGGEKLKSGSFIPSEETMDVMDLLGGGHLGPYLETLQNLMQNLQVVAEAFSDRSRSEALVGMFDQVLPTLKDIRELAQQATRKKNLEKTLAQTSEMFPNITEFSKRLPELGENSAKVMEQLGKLTEDLNKVLPAIAAVAPEASQKSIEALREAVVVLKAMQKSFLLKGAVKDVKEEEAELAKEKAKNDKERAPASQNKIY